MKTGVTIFFVLFTSFSCLGSSIASEVDYPTKPIEIMVGYAPGAGTDLGTRMVADISKKSLGQEVIVSNKPGGGGRVALTLVAKAKPDGYSLAAVPDGPIILMPHLEAVPYKIQDFTFISQFGVLDVGVVVLPDSPFHTFKELTEFARANPDKLTISTPGVGTTNHVAFQAFSLLEGLKIKLVPFSGANPAVTALLGGHVMVASTSTSGYSTHLKAQKVRLLAVIGDERMEDYPDVPTLKELGYPLVFQSWYVIVGPKNMEKAIVKKLGEVFKKSVETPAFIKLAKDLEMWTKTPLQGDELKERVIQRNAKYEELFRKLGMGIK